MAFGYSRELPPAESATPLPTKTSEPTFDIVDVMQRVMQGMFEQTPHVASVSSDSQTTRPAIGSRIIGEFRQTHRLFRQRVDDSVGIGTAAARSRGFDQFLIDLWERRLVERKRLFNPEHMQRRDVSTVRRIFERRPHFGLGTRTQFGTGIG
jgi:hypothetical protein